MSTKVTTTRAVGNNSLQATIPKFLYQGIEKHKVVALEWKKNSKGVITVRIKGEK